MARERGDPPVPPLIVTAELEPATADRLDAERRRHFPPERNFLRAHLTLFHALPDEVDAVLAAVRAAAPPSPLPAVVSGVIKLGRGVAYGIDCPQLPAVRSRIAAGFDLTPQDRSWRRPHVTVQNKVAPAEADALFHELTASFEPWPTMIVGVALHHYRGGPWSPAGHVTFGG